MNCCCGFVPIVHDVVIVHLFCIFSFSVSKNGPASGSSPQTTTGASPPLLADSYFSFLGVFMYALACFATCFFVIPFYSPFCR